VLARLLGTALAMISICAIFLSFATIGLASPGLAIDASPSSPRVAATQVYGGASMCTISPGSPPHRDVPRL
jgi:hypothetical protein